jgi:hypothetical protein
MGTNLHKKLDMGQFFCSKSEMYLISMWLIEILINFAADFETKHHRIWQVI